VLSDYSCKFGLQVNESKAKVMVFSNSVSRPDIQPLILNNKQIETVKEYKYLGIVFTQYENLQGPKETGSASKESPIYPTKDC